MKVLVIGSGGREHALVWKLRQSPRVEELYCASGNGGTAGLAENVPIEAKDIAGLLQFAKEHQIDLTVVGPEDPLVNGIVDAFEAEGLRIFGPNQKAAILEGSKDFTKGFLRRHGIPTAEYITGSNPEEVLKFALHAFRFPMVVKADGLAAGKGVHICHNKTDVEDALQAILVDKIYGAEAGKCVVVEEFLEGEEASCIVIADENMHVLMFPSSQDHKRIGDGDTGLNTGGMGAYSPAPVFTQKMEQQVLDRIIYPTLRGMKAEGRPFRGVLYAGLMIKNGIAKVLEYNVRFGDPEIQAILFRMESDLVPILLAAIEGNLDEQQIVWSSKPVVSVVLAAKGYPGKYAKGDLLTGIQEAEAEEGVVVFHAGTIRNAAGEIVTNGGRVFDVTAEGFNFPDAIERVYRAVAKIQCGGEGLVYRRDIAQRAINR